jgi:hypothetical protein
LLAFSYCSIIPPLRHYLTLASIQQQIHQHELLKQLSMMNKQLSLLRAQQSNTNTSVPLENATNLLVAVANVLPSTSTNAAKEESSNSKKKASKSKPSGETRGRKPYPLDANGNKIRPEKENKKRAKTKSNQKNSLAQNFLSSRPSFVLKNIAPFKRIKC